MRRAVAAGVLLVLVGGCVPQELEVASMEHTPQFFDGPLSLRAFHADAGQEITLRAATTDASGAEWSSAAVFEADEDGVVDLTTDAPIRGDYSGVHDTGLLWSMSSGGRYFVAPPGDLTVRVSLVADDEEQGEISVVRRFAADRTTTRVLTVAADGFAGVFFEPRFEAGRPAILAFGGSEGGPHGGVALARSLAAKGYPALGIAYFGAPGLPASLDGIPLEYFARALRFLGHDYKKILTYGVSRGSEAALLLGVHFPDLVSGVVAGSPSSVVNPGWPSTDRPAWTLGGKPLPRVSAAEYMTPATTNRAAIIEAERIRGPVFLICGTDDQIWPSCDYADAIAARRPVALVRGEGAGHYIGDPTPNLPIRPDAMSGGELQADATARLIAWDRLLKFLASV